MSIISELKELKDACEPLKFLKEDGSIDTTEGQAIISKLLEELDANPTLLALSAPQIGIKKRIFGIRFDDGVKIFIDPVIKIKKGCVISPEICASMPGQEILIARPEEITAVYYNKDFKYEDNKFLGMAARLFDQQVQFLDGVVPSDLGLVSTIETDGKLEDLAEEDFLELVEMYKKFINIKKTRIEKEFSSNKTLRENYKALQFTEQVINGRNQVIYDEPVKNMNREQRRAAAKQQKRIAAGKRNKK